MVKASSSSDHEPAGQPAAAGSSVVASSRTCRRCRGGKDRRAAGPGRVVQAGQPGRGEAAAPQADGVLAATELPGDLQVGGLVRAGGAEDDAGAADQGLRGGVGAGQALQGLTLLAGKG